MFNESSSVELFTPPIQVASSKPLVQITDITETAIVAKVSHDIDTCSYLELRNQTTIKTVLLPLTNPGYGS